MGGAHLTDGQFPHRDGHRSPRRHDAGRGDGLAAALLAAVLPRAPWPLRSTPVTDVEHVHGLAVDPQDPRVLWVGTHAGLVRVVEPDADNGRRAVCQCGWADVADSGPR